MVQNSIKVINDLDIQINDLKEEIKELKEENNKIKEDMQNKLLLLEEINSTLSNE